MVYGLRSNFDVLYIDGVDSGASSWFHVGIDEALLKVLVVNWCTLVLGREFRSERDMCCP